jgi:pyruvate,water dikinase
VAVRSSATAEDLEDASFAGQQETFLNVVGTAALGEAIRRCWASLWSGPAIAYRRREGIDPAEVALAVVVQVLVPADSAGVLFTADPVSGRRDHLVIDATWGLGEALVGGQVTPDHLVIETRTGVVLSEEIADKKVMTVRDDQGVSLVPTPEDLRRAAVLSTEQVSALVEIARAIHAHAGRPSDVEWVSHQGRILVTQARAVTSLPPDLLGMEWSRQMLIERYPDPLTPLTWSALSSTFFASMATTVRSLGGELPADVPMIRLIHGRAYVNVTAFQQGMQSLPLRPPVASSDEGDSGDAARGDGDAGRTRPRAAMASAALGLVRLVLGTHRDWERRLPGYVERITAGASTRWQERSTADLLATRHTSAEALIPMLDNHARAIVAADLTLQLLGGITRRWLADEDQTVVLALLSGLTGNLTVQTNRELWQLAQIDPSSTEFEAGLAGFLERYGHRSPRYEFNHPTWREDPSQVRELIALMAAGSPDPAIGETKLRAARELATAQARARLPLAKRVVFDQALSLAQTYFRLRENQQFYLVLGVPMMRAILLELGRRFAAEGLLPAAADVFLLENDEVNALAARIAGAGHNGPPAPADPLRLVEERRAELDRHRRTSAPVHLGGAPPPVTVGDGGMQGIAASRGTATGRARLVRGPEDFAAVRPGDILVAPATSPAWTPLFGVVAGLVTEFGGLLSHAGVVAREYGLPAVLGVPGVMSRISNGDLLTVEGHLGLVTVVVGQPTETAGDPAEGLIA